MWIEAVEGPRKMKPSFSADSEVGSEDSNFARSARAAREASRPPLGASSENWQACGGQGWFVKPPRRRPFQELRDAVDLVVVSAVRKAE